MRSRATQHPSPALRTITSSIQQLLGQFKAEPSVFSGEDALHTKLSTLLVDNLHSTAQTTTRATSIVHRRYPTPFKCQMGDLRFEVLEDRSRGKRGHYDIAVLSPWWLDKASLKAIRNDNFALFRKYIRDKAEPQDPPLCLAGIEIYLIHTERPRLADYSRIGQDYRKLLLSGALASSWRFMDHRYMLAFSQHSQPHEAKWRGLVEASWERDVDPKNVWLIWTSPQGSRSSA